MDEIQKPIVAYKFLVWGGEQFYSPMKLYRWLPGWNVIENGPIDTTATGRNGFYSFKKPAQEDLLSCPYLAEIEISGTIVEHEWGYRSEFARISRIIDWATRYYSEPIARVARLHGNDHSTDRCRSTWPKVTPHTKVYALPPKPAVSQYHFPIIAEPTAENYHQDKDGGVLVPYSILTIPLDKAHRDSRGYGAIISTVTTPGTIFASTGD